MSIDILTREEGKVVMLWSEATAPVDVCREAEIGFLAKLLLGVHAA